MINETVYGRLLRKTLPRPIRTEKENERCLRVVEHLMDLGDRMTLEQRELLDPLVVLIERFESDRYALSAASPSDVLHELMEARGMKFAELAALIGSKGVASEILSGKRGLSKANITRLAPFWRLTCRVSLRACGKLGCSARVQPDRTVKSERPRTRKEGGRFFRLRAFNSVILSRRAARAVSKDLRAAISGAFKHLPLRSCQRGLTDFIKATFLCLGHPFDRFSLAIIARTSLHYPD